MKPKYKIELYTVKKSNDDNYIINIAIYKKCVSCPCYHYHSSYSLPFSEYSDDAIHWRKSFKIFNEGVQEIFKDENL